MVLSMSRQKVVEMDATILTEEDEVCQASSLLYGKRVVSQLNAMAVRPKNRVDPHAEHAALTTMAADDAPVYEAIGDQQER